MNKVLLLLSIVLCSTYTQAQKRKTTSSDPLAGLDTTINRILNDWHAAGCAVAIVKKDKVLLVKGFGYRDFDKKTPVTENTLFAIGSCTKSFTASLMGMLVKEGKLDIDKPAHDYLPELEFYNEYLTAHVTTRDMMTHRTGLPRHDLAWYASPAPRDSILYRIRFLEPNAGLREKWQYNNFMYLAQGMLAEKLYDKKWETIIQEKLFDPLGMSQSDFSVNDLQKTPDYSLAYGERKDTLYKMDFRPIENMGPAGSINSSAKDMANWVITWINNGKFKGKEVLPSNYVRDAISSQMVVNGNLPDEQDATTYFSNYGFGWMLSSYRGHYRVEHGGNIDGFSANTSFFPSDSIGIVVLSNQNASAVPSLIRNTIADRLLQLPYRNWSKIALDQNKKNKAGAEQMSSLKDTGQVKNTHPSHDLEDYAGAYAHPGYGDLQLAWENDTLWVRQRGNEKEKVYLEHYHYDVFSLRTYESEPGSPSTKIQFSMDMQGKIKDFSIALEPTVSNIIFTRTQPVIEKSKEELQQYTGTFILGQMSARFYISGKDILKLVVPGQPEYELKATGTDAFQLKEVKGYSVKFLRNDSGRIEAVNFIQPNGTFKATKKE